MAACVCGHAEEEHPNGRECEGDPVGALVRDGEKDPRCGCVMFEPDEEED